MLRIRGFSWPGRLIRTVIERTEIEFLVGFRARESGLSPNLKVRATHYPIGAEDWVSLSLRIRVLCFSFLYWICVHGIGVDEMKDVVIALGKRVSACCGGYGWSSEGGGEVPWNVEDLGKHSYGEFSMASIQANHQNEDSFHIEACPPFGGLFVGIYDGHGGHEASQFVRNHLFGHLTSKTCQNTSYFKPLQKTS